MTLEQFKPNQESKPNLTPRHELEKLLSREKPGSMKINAYADMASLRLAQSSINSIESRERGTQPPSHDYIQAAAKKAQIEETIRGREFGEKAAEYIETCESGDNILRSYWYANKVEAGTGAVTGETMYDVELSDTAAAEAMLNDLKEINKQKSQHPQSQ